MKTKKPRGHIFDLEPEAQIREIDKVLKKLQQLPRTPQIMKSVIGIQMQRAQLKTELSNRTLSPKNNLTT